MGRYVATQTLKLLSQQKILTSNAKIAVLGFSFKENIPDFRNTKVIQIINELKKWKANVEVFDDVVSKEEVENEYGIIVKNLNQAKKKKFDAIILAVSHKEFNKSLNYYNPWFKNINKKILVDIKNIFPQKELIKNNYNFFQL